MPKGLDTLVPGAEGDEEQQGGLGEWHGRLQPASCASSSLIPSPSSDAHFPSLGPRLSNRAQLTSERGDPCRRRHQFGMNLPAMLLPSMCTPQERSRGFGRQRWAEDRAPASG